jgi:hypothetical protein
VRCDLESVVKLRDPCIEEAAAYQSHVADIAGQQHLRCRSQLRSRLRSRLRSDMGVGLKDAAARRIIR